MIRTIVGVLSLFCLVSCGAGTGQNNTNQSSTPQEQPQIFVELNPDFFSVQGGAEVPVLVKGQQTAALVVDFNNRPGVKAFLKALRLHQESDVVGGNFAHPTLSDGTGLPLTSEEDFVDDVVVFSFPTPLELIKGTTTIVTTLRTDEEPNGTTERIFIAGPEDLEVVDETGQPVNIRANNSFPLSSAVMPVTVPQPYLNAYLQAQNVVVQVQKGATGVTLGTLRIAANNASLTPTAIALQILNQSGQRMGVGKPGLSGILKIVTEDGLVIASIATDESALYGNSCTVASSPCTWSPVSLSFSQTRPLRPSDIWRIFRIVADMPANGRGGDGFVLVVDSIDYTAPDGTTQTSYIMMQGDPIIMVE